MSKTPLKLLKEIEFSGNFKTCPICEGGNKAGHHENCQIGQAISLLEARLETSHVWQPTRADGTKLSTYYCLCCHHEVISNATVCLYCNSTLIWPTEENKVLLESQPVVVKLEGDQRSLESKREDDEIDQKAQEANKLIHLEAQPEPSQSEIDAYVSAFDGDISDEYARKKLREIKSQPEPGEFTEHARHFIPPRDVFDNIKLYEDSEKPGYLEILLHEACNRIDALTFKLKNSNELKNQARNRCRNLEAELRSQQTEIECKQAEIRGLRERIDEVMAEIEQLKSQEPPCNKTCYHHQTHPCESCGRINGYLPSVWQALQGDI